MIEQTGSAPTYLAREMFSALGRHDLDALQAYHHPEVVQDFVPIGTYRGRPALRGFFAELLAAFPDFAIDILDVIGDGDRVVAQWHISGTFTGAAFQGIHATGKPADLRGCDVMRFEDRMLRENVVYYDGLTFARQVGLLPREGSAADKAMTAAFNASTDLRARLHKRNQEMAHAG